MAKAALGLATATEAIAESTIASDTAAQLPLVSSLTATVGLSPKRYVAALPQTSKPHAMQDEGLLAWLSDRPSQNTQTIASASAYQSSESAREELAAESYDDALDSLLQLAI
jgi:hypothetical protein